MIDIKVLRENPKEAEKRLALKNAQVDVEAILALDDRRRALNKETDEMKYRRNTVSGEISRKKRDKEDASAEISDMQKLSAEIHEKDVQIAEVQKELQSRLMEIPNMPSPWTPAGSSEADNVVLRFHGEQPVFDFEPKDHLEVAERLQMLDIKRGAKISGSGFPLYTDKGARLERALVNFMLDLHTVEHDYKEVFPPFLVHSNSATGTGQLPKMSDDMYYLEGDDLWLIPTAEVPVTNIHREEVLSAAELPIRYVAYSACFRREAGSYGKDTRGLQRLHQFNKVELLHFVHPDRSYEVWEQLIGHAETVLQKLGLSYRVIELCSADLSFAAARCCDIELWSAGSKKWLEVSSCSNFEDFQARRANIRFRDENGMRFVHTLNGSGVATPRLMIALIEHYQQADGSLRIPEALQPYFGAEIIRS